jgi:hypothetical protein
MDLQGDCKLFWQKSLSFIFDYELMGGGNAERYEPNGDQTNLTDVFGGKVT